MAVDHRNNHQPPLIYSHLDAGPSPPVELGAVRSPSDFSQQSPTSLKSPPLSGAELRSFALEQEGSEWDHRRQEQGKRWRPIPFTKWYSISLILLMIALGITMEVLYWVSRDNKGFSVSLLREGHLRTFHYVYTTLVVALSLPITAAWGYLDWAIKSVQPYIDLQHGAATADRSVLLNYVGDSQFLVLWPAMKRRHYLTLASSLNVSTTSLAQLGLSDNYASLLAISSASGFTLGRVTYNAPWPPFIDANGAVSRFEVLPSWGTNGSVNAYSITVKTFPRCSTATTTVTGSSGDWSITGASGTCSYSFTSAATGTSAEFGVGVADCSDSPGTDLQFEPAVFTAFSGGDASVVVCRPAYECRNVLASVNLNTGGLLPTQQVGLVPNNTNPLFGAPLFGRALNGVSANGSDISDRLSGGLTNLATAVATRSGSASIGDESAMLAAVSGVYGIYVDVFAASSYFVPVSTQTTAELLVRDNRLWVAAFAAHILAGLFFFFAIAGSALMRAHALARRGLALSAEPGTIATAASVAGQSDLAYLIEAKDDGEMMQRLLRKHRFALDKETGRIVVVQEVDARTPSGEGSPRRTTFFHRATS